MLLRTGAEHRSRCDSSGAARGEKPLDRFGLEGLATFAVDMRAPDEPGGKEHAGDDHAGEQPSGELVCGLGRKHGGAARGRAAACLQVRLALGGRRLILELLAHHGRRAARQAPTSRPWPQCRRCGSSSPCRTPSSASAFDRSTGERAQSFFTVSWSGPPTTFMRLFHAAAWPELTA